MANADEAVPGTKHIILLGASVGKAWKIHELPMRVSARGYTFEYVGEYDFDKSKSLADILKRANAPDVIFLKECAAYFPGSLVHYENLVKRWVGQCLQRKVLPILVTVAPVRNPTFWELQYWKNIIKKVIYPKNTIANPQLTGLTAFNDWVRKYALEQNLPVLDLERALRVSETDRGLKPEFDVGDGLHLNPKAYAVIDLIVIPTLERVDWNRVNSLQR